MASSITPLGLALLPNTHSAQLPSGLFGENNVWDHRETDRQSEDTIDWARVLAPSVQDSAARQTIADHIKLFASSGDPHTSRANFGPLSSLNPAASTFGDPLIPPSSGATDQSMRAFSALLHPHSQAGGQSPGLSQGPRPNLPSLLSPLPSGSPLLPIPPGSVFQAPHVYGAMHGSGQGAGQGYGQPSAVAQGTGLGSLAGLGTPSQSGGGGQGGRGLSPQEAAAVLTMVQELDRQLHVARAQAALLPALQASLAATSGEVAELRASRAKEAEAAGAQAQAYEQQLATLREELASASKSTAASDQQAQVAQLRERLQESARRAKAWQEEKGELEGAVQAAQRAAGEAMEEAAKERKAAAEAQAMISTLQSEQERLLGSLRTAREEVREARASSKEAVGKLEKELRKAMEGTKKSDSAEKEKAAALKANVEKLSVQVELLADAVKSRDSDVQRLTTSVSSSTKQLSVVQMALDKVQKERDALREELVSTQDLLSETRKSQNKAKDAEGAARAAMAGWRHKFVQVGQELARAREQHARDKTAWEVIFEAMRLSLLDEVEGVHGGGGTGEAVPPSLGPDVDPRPISAALYRQQLQRSLHPSPPSPQQTGGSGVGGPAGRETEELLPSEPAHPQPDRESGSSPGGRSASACTGSSPLDEALSARAKAFRAAATQAAAAQGGQEGGDSTSGGGSSSGSSVTAVHSVRQIAVSQARQLLAASRDVLLDRSASGRDFLARLGFVSDGSGSGALTFVGLEGGVGVGVGAGAEGEVPPVQEGDLAPLSLPQAHALSTAHTGQEEGSVEDASTTAIVPASPTPTAPLLSSSSGSGSGSMRPLAKLEDDYFDDPLRVPFVSISYLQAEDDSCLKRLQSIVKLGCPVDRSRDVKTLLYCVASGKMRCVAYLMEQGVRHADNDAVMRVAALAVRYAVESWSNIDSKKAKEEMCWRLGAGVTLVSSGCPLQVPEEVRKRGENGQVLEKLDDPVYRYDPDRSRYGQADLWASVPVILGVKEYAAEWKEAAPPVTGKATTQDSSSAPCATGGRRFTTFRVAAKAKIVAELWAAWEKEWGRVQGGGLGSTGGGGLQVGGSGKGKKLIGREGEPAMLSDIFGRVAPAVSTGNPSSHGPGLWCMHKMIRQSKGLFPRL